MFAPKVASAHTKADASSRSRRPIQRDAFATRPFARQAEQESDPTSETAQAALGPMWSFSKLPPPDRPNRPNAIFPLVAPSRAGVIQREPAVGVVDNPLKHKADRIGDQVIRMPHHIPSISASPVQVSCKCAACEEENKLQMKPAGLAPSVAMEVPNSVHETLRQPGQPLDTATRATLEPRFGHDFSRVRIHADAKAAASARAVAAHAYTVGRSIVFGAGRYAPGTESGRRLLAHELTHVVQQGFSHNNGALTVGPEDDSYEREADAVADEVGAHSASRNSEPADAVARRDGMDLEPRGAVQGVIQRDADSDDYKQGYQDGLNGGESQAVPRGGEALADYDAGYAKGHNEFIQQTSPGGEPLPAVSEAQAPASPAPTPGSTGTPADGGAPAPVSADGGAPAATWEDRASRPASKAIIRALERVDPEAAGGVGDFRAAFAIIKDLAMFDILATLDELNGLGELQLLRDHINEAVDVDRARIELAIVAVAERVTVTQKGWPPAQGEAFAALPPEQQSDVTKFLGTTPTIQSREQEQGVNAEDVLLGVLIGVAVVGAVLIVVTQPELLPEAAALGRGAFLALRIGAAAAPAVTGAAAGGEVVLVGEVAATSVEAAEIGGTATRAVQVTRVVLTSAPTLAQAPAATVAISSSASSISQAAAILSMGAATTTLSSDNPTKKSDDEEDNLCTKQYPDAIPIRWPQPTWTLYGLGDPGATDPTYDYPPERLLTKRGSTFYDQARPEIGRYLTRIEQPPFSIAVPPGYPVHHKWPLFLGGPGNAEKAEGDYDAEGRVVSSPNLVVLSPEVHTAWHRYLRLQPAGPRPGQGPGDGTPDGTQFCVMDFVE